MNKITFDDAAKMLSVTRQTIYNYIDKGFLKPQKAFNGRVFFLQDEIERLKNLPMQCK